MLRKKSAQEALLLSPESSSLNVQSSYDSTGSIEDDIYVELRLTASCGGVLGRVKVFEDASFTFLPHEDPTFKPDLLYQCCCSGQDIELQVPGQDVVGATVEGERGFKLWFCRLPSKHQIKPVRKVECSQVFQTGSADEAKRCQVTLQQSASWGRQSQPRRVTVIINPKSGQGRSKAMFQSPEIQSIFKAAGLSLSVWETNRPGHASEMVKNLDLAACDALVTVGGDGTVHEALQGLLGRPDWQEAAKLPFAMLPTGSGNALAANTGMWDVVTAAYAICKGRTRSIDIVSMLQPPSTRFFSFLSLNFGLISNLDIGTENLRWMGNLRFTLGAIQQILQGKTHQAHIAVLPLAKADTILQDAAVDDPEGGDVKESGLRGHHPEGPPLPLLDAFLSQTSSSAWPIQLPDGWENIDGAALQLCAACNLPWLDTSFQLAPDAEMDSGCLDLIYTGLAGKLEGLQMMTKVETGSHMGMSLVQCKKVCALVLEPISTGTWLVLDGETIPYERVYAEVHKSLCTVIVA
ncbi:hypothetical protein WJX82_000765 [Trebouxia sp. C0006]